MGPRSPRGGGNLQSDNVVSDRRPFVAVRCPTNVVRRRRSNKRALASVALVPTDAPLIIEAKIKPDNVREIAPNSHADVRLTAYNPRTSPVLEGTVTYLSADSLNDKETRQPFYLAHIEIPPGVVARANRVAKEPIVLGPGLHAEVFIKTRSRSAFDYLFEPVWDGIEKSMRD